MPLDTCRAGASERSALFLHDALNNARDVLKWTITRGGPAAVGDLKVPTVPGSTVALCVYDQSANAQPLLSGLVPTGGTCGRRSCWKTLGGSGGFVYRNEAGTSAGLDGLRLRVSASGALQLAADGRGVNLPMPTLGFTLPVTVQLVIADDAGSVCWQARFNSTQRNDATTFRAVLR